MANKIFFTFLFWCVLLNAQQSKPLINTFGEITSSDLDYSVYSPDPEQPAVVLYERGKNTVENIGNYLRLVKTVHRKIKVLDASRFEDSEINIYYYQDGGFPEKVIDVQAITHNGKLKTYVKSESIFDIDVSEEFSKKAFTFSNIRDGSILEYSYRIESPFFFNFGDWNFQEKLPKLYSEISADIPGNYVYKRSIRGDRKLDVKINSVKERCLYIEGFSKPADCDSFTYAMYNIPPFKEEPFMLSKENYISKISFELQEYVNFKGEKDSYSKTWKDVEREFKYDKDMGRQLKMAPFFEAKIPNVILGIEDEKERAQAIFYNIQKHFTWNGEYKIFSDIRVKDAYNEGSGNIAEINLSLINALRAAGLEAKIALSATRDLGLLSDLYPVLTDFNYVTAYIVLGGESYLLDATDPHIPFGLLPFRALNGKVRVMDFRKKSFWHEIAFKARNLSYSNIEATFTNEALEGKFIEFHSGYEAIKWRNKIVVQGDEVINRGGQSDFEIKNVVFDENKFINDKPFKVSSEIRHEFLENNGFIYLNPLMMNFEMVSNPFIKGERLYPVDLGYSYSRDFVLKLTIPVDYSFESIPENKVFILGAKKASCSVRYSQNENILNCSLRFKLDVSYYGIDDYTELHSFFKSIADEHRNSLVKIKVGK